MQFDVVIGGDWRLEGGITVAAEHEIRCLAAAKLRVGLLNLASHLSATLRPLDPLLARHVKAKRATLLSAPVQSVSTRLLCLRHPAVIPDSLEKLQGVSADRVLVIVDRAPVDGAGGLVYDPHVLHALLEQRFPGKVYWAPISGVCRQNLKTAAPDLPVLDFDWINFIYPDEWQGAKRKTPGKIPVIGRHGRAAWDKWPDNRQALFAAYPPTPDIKVRLMGTGDRLLELAGQLPSNWTELDWNEVPVPKFLQSLDFFVYYHHSLWVESFGRTILEAIASGCVAILPEYLRQTFGDAAIYAPPERVRAIVSAFHASRSKYLAQSRLGQRLASEQFGPEAFLSVVRRALASHSPVRAAAAKASKAKSSAVAKASKAQSPIDVAAENFARRKPKAFEDDVASIGRPAFKEYDVAYLGDFGRNDPSAVNIAEELAIASQDGYRAVLLAFGGQRTSGDDLSPCLAALVREGKVSVIDDPSAWVACRLLVVTSVESIRTAKAIRVSAEETIVVPDNDYAGNAGEDHASAMKLFGAGVSWAPTTNMLRGRLDGKVPLQRSNWSVAVRPLAKSSDRNGNAALVVGYAGGHRQENWPAAAKLQQLLPADSRLVVHVLGWPPGGLDGTATPPRGWHAFHGEFVTLRKFIRQLDVLAYFPRQNDGNVPLAAIALALSAGLPVLLPPALRNAVGRGPVYVEASNLPKTLLGLIASRGFSAAQKAELQNLAKLSFGAQLHQRRLAQFVGSPVTVRSRPAKATKHRRILMLSSNGTGLGHVARQLAIARHLPETVEPVFAAMGHGVGIIRQFGFVAEYIPSQIYTGTKFPEWNKWLEFEINRLVEFYDCAAVVFDGNMPADGLLRAVGPREDAGLVWIRRGMWQAGQDSSAIATQRYFDLVIEPTDIASEVDQGATARAGDVAERVPPVRLLEASELLSREQACARLGLDPAKPAVLVQIGSGSNRENLSMLDELIPHLRTQPGLQIAIAEWDISTDHLRLWPGTLMIRGFPLSQYFNAFDFTVTAAGYNSFNEVISFGLPAIFIPNTHPGMDDQAGRAGYAEKHGAGIVLKADQLGEIVDLLPLMLNASSRSYIRQNCSRISLENGAAQAASLISQLVEQMRP